MVGWIRPKAAIRHFSHRREASLSFFDATHQNAKTSDCAASRLIQPTICHYPQTKNCMAAGFLFLPIHKGAISPLGCAKRVQLGLTTHKRSPEQEGTRSSATPSCWRASTFGGPNGKPQGLPASLVIFRFVSSFGSPFWT